VEVKLKKIGTGKIFGDSIERALCEMAKEVSSGLLDIQN